MTDTTLIIPSHNGAQSQRKDSLSVVSTSSDPADLEVLPKGPPMSEVFLKRMLLPVLVGCVFGAALARGGVHEPLFIRNQFLFKNFVMLKMFVAAAATSTIALTAVVYLRGGEAACSLGSGLTREFPRGLWAMVVGGGLLGAGMTVSGSCPGTVYAQLGAGSTNAPLVFAGGLVGAMLYSVFNSFVSFQNFLAYKRDVFGTENKLSSLLNLPVAVVATGMTLAMAGGVLALELVVPWKEDAALLYPAAEANWSHLLAPCVAGVFIGLCQLPLAHQVCGHLGASGSYMTIIANVLRPFGTTGSPDLNFFRGTLTPFTGLRFDQLFLVAGIVLGAALNNVQSDVGFKSDSFITKPEAFFGGLMIVMGARIAAGCTSGLGLSGMGYLALTSMVGVASLFAFAVITAFIFYH